MLNLMLSHLWTHLAREGQRLAVVHFPHSTCIAHSQAIVRLHTTYAPSGRVCTVNKNLKLSRLGMKYSYVLLNTGISNPVPNLVGVRQEKGAAQVGWYLFV